MKRDQPINAYLPDQITLTAFLALVIITGGASVAIRFTYAELPPFWSGAARFICGGLFIWALVLIGEIALPRGKALLGAILFRVLGMGLSLSLITQESIIGASRHLLYIGSK